MDEKGEVPGKEQVVIPPDLKDRMGEATRAIESDAIDPASGVAAGTEQVGMFQELGQLWKDTAVKRLGIMFKDVKAVVGILPFVNKISELNSARIAGIPAKKLAAGLSISPKEQAAADIENAVIAKRHESALHAVESAARYQKPVADADAAMMRAEDEWHRARVSLARAQEKGKGVDQARIRLDQKFAAYQDSVKGLRAVKETYQPLENTALQRLGGVHVPEKGEPHESWASKKIRSVMEIKNDVDVKQKFLKVKADYKKATGQELSDTIALRMAANGEAPAFGTSDKLKKGAKMVARNMLLEHLGPIINPVPDVPGFITMPSYLLEAFGGQWWAGLIPPVWQYAHNRFEDAKLSYESSKKASEIIKRHWNARFAKLEDKQTQKAADMFLPNKEASLPV